MNKISMRQGTEMPEDLADALSINQASEEIHVARNTILSWIDQQLLDEFRIGGHPFVSKKQLLQLNTFRLDNKMYWKLKWKAHKDLKN